MVPTPTNVKKTTAAGRVSTAVEDLDEIPALAKRARELLAELAEVVDQMEGRCQLAADELR